jgi:hypothetical protein
LRNKVSSSELPKNNPLLRGDTMFNNINKLTETLHAGLIQGVELASVWLIWLGLQIMMVVAEVASTKSTD